MRASVILLVVNPDLAHNSLYNFFFFNWYKMLILKWKFDEDASVDEITVSTAQAKSSKSHHKSL